MKTRWYLVWTWRRLQITLQISSDGYMSFSDCDSVSGTGSDFLSSQPRAKSKIYLSIFLRSADVCSFKSDAKLRLDSVT